MRIQTSDVQQIIFHSTILQELVELHLSVAEKLLYHLIKIDSLHSDPWDLLESVSSLLDFLSSFPIPTSHPIFPFYFFFFSLRLSFSLFLSSF